MSKPQAILERSRGYKKSGVSTAEATDRRRQEVALTVSCVITPAYSNTYASKSTIITQQRRDAHLRAKRLRFDQSAAQATDGESSVQRLLDPAEQGQRIRSIIAAVKSAGGVGTQDHLLALRTLRQLTSDAAHQTDDADLESIFSLLVSEGAVPLLIAALQPRVDSAVARQAVVEAAWALTNMAAAEHNTAEAVLQSGPLLIAHLSGGFGIYAAEQCAWALGNLAGDCRDFRERLLAEGTMLPLVRLVLSGRSKSEGAATAVAARTAAWALSNLIRNAGTEVKDMLAVNGCPGGLCELLRHSEPGLVTEVAWVTAYATASQQVRRLLATGILQPLLALLSRVAEEGRALEDAEGQERMQALATPVLRSIGNLIAAAGSSAADMSLLLCDPGGPIADVMGCVRGSHRGLQKEALWVLSNITGLPGRAGVQALTAAGATGEVVQLLREAVFPVRKEAAFVVANICAGGGDGSGDQQALQSLVGSDPAAVEQGVLPTMMELLMCPDPEASFLAMQFVEMVLRVLPGGPQIVESADGISALEDLQMKGNSQQQVLVTQLLHSYYGDDYGL